MVQPAEGLDIDKCADIIQWIEENSVLPRWNWVFTPYGSMHCFSCNHEATTRHLQTLDHAARERDYRESNFNEKRLLATLPEAIQQLIKRSETERRMLKNERVRQASQNQGQATGGYVTDQQFKGFAGTRLNAISEFVKSCIPSGEMTELPPILQFVVQYAIKEIVWQAKSLPRCGANYVLKLSRENLEPLYFVATENGATNIRWEAGQHEVWAPDEQVRNLVEFFQKSITVKNTPSYNPFHKHMRKLAEQVLVRKTEDNR